MTSCFLFFSIKCHPYWLDSLTVAIRIFWPEEEEEIWEWWSSSSWPPRSPDSEPWSSSAAAWSRWTPWEPCQQSAGRTGSDSWTAGLSSGLVQWGSVHSYYTSDTPRGSCCSHTCTNQYQSDNRFGHGQLNKWFNSIVPPRMTLKCIFSLTFKLLN